VISDGHPYRKQRNEVLMAQVLEAINGLAQAQERRLDDLESR
jgi:hypothetical protein